MTDQNQPGIHESEYRTRGKPTRPNQFSIGSCVFCSVTNSDTGSNYTEFGTVWDIIDGQLFDVYLVEMMTTPKQWGSFLIEDMRMAGRA